MNEKKIEQLKACVDRKDLARLLGFKPKALSYILYQRTPCQNYRTFKIPKRKGGERVIDAPNPELLFLQKRASNLLQDCLDEIVQDEGHKRTIHHGFQRKKSIITNARVHRARKFVFNVDLTDFFPSVNFGRILGFFQKNRHFTLEREVAVTLAQICCYDGQLPQGAPTSPVVSNLICQPLDIRLSRLAEKFGCSYSRYADDITFSTSTRKFPRAISRKSLISSKWYSGRILKKEIKSAGFAINPKKTRMQYAQSRQTVTGLIVNDKINVPADYTRLCRAMVDAYVKSGTYFIRKEKLSKSGKVKVTKEPGTDLQLIGRYSFIHNVKSSNFSKENPRPKDLFSYEKDYRRLLLFSKFHFSKIPLILTEGKTDTIYIKAALRRLHKSYPTLITKKGRSFEYNFDFFKFSPTNRRILGIDGGTSHLAGFLSTYRKEAKSFCPILNQKPVICIIDNDNGAKKFFKWTDSSGNKINRDGEVYHLFENVYLLLTPLKNGTEDSKIEDFFTKHTLNEKIGGKSFNPENVGVTEAEYGKAWFASKVVWPKKSTINFNNFKPLLDLIENTAMKVHNPKK
ncbi:retron Ec67 family RNA-directed DNA polymerase/endonuclease [Pseudoblastomonas halimionae]|uniref:RNA-directed DNA polymerase n=1 Tax=Alteriqipengyuania halimionae TaxID=1926630 RepID=A0A6I4U1F7_9SPHN|nr:retron Ec67 family RNA-directed DNA polymerase/endonuclease [Alteriqipengyuania halimionae]MXP09830.1 RNA-directed DNA polymerase [Alteriqipengyuania halimionae]